MKRLWVAAAMAPLMFAAAAHAAGPTTISTTVTTPQATSSTGDLTIGTTGSVAPATAGSVAVTIDSSNNVTVDGAIDPSTGLNNVTGILGKGGNAGNIINAGTITLGETTTYTDANKDGIADTNGSGSSTVIGQFTAGQNRYGIVLSGPGVFTGTITNSGGINVTGDNSAGILLNTQLTGDLISSGTVVVVGGNYFDLATPTIRDSSTSYGIRSNALIQGNVSLSGNITATGNNAVGVSLEQGVTGQVEIFGTITATGFRSVAGATETATLAILDNGTTTSAGELMRGGPALHIVGNVGKGVSIDAAVAGVPASGSTPAVAGVSAGTIYSYGSAPAIQIDGAGTIGLYKSTTYGMVIGGNVSAFSVYAFEADPASAAGLLIPVSTTGLLVGGSEAISGGVDVTGTVSAASISIGSGATADSTAVHFTGTASTPRFNLGYGSLISGSTRATNAPNVSAVLIDSGATVGSMVNDGTIAASVSGYNTVTNAVPNPATGGTAGYATAVYDKGGKIASIDNRGAITTGFSPAVSGATVTGSTIALDLRANTTGVAVTQDQITLANSASFAAANALSVTNTGTALTAPTPSISGDILFGSGNATLSVQAGGVAGGISFGAGTNTLNIGTAGASVVNTAANPLEVKGALVNTGTLSVDVTNGTLYTTNNVYNAATYNAVTNPAGPIGRTADNPGGIAGSALTGPVHLSSLHVGGPGAGSLGGSLIFTANPSSGLNDQFNVSGTATLDSGAQIGVALTGKISSLQSYTVITAGTLNASSVSQALLGSIPYLYVGSVTATTGAGGKVVVSLSPRTAAQAGLNPGETAAFNAVFADFDKEAATSAALLGKTSKADFTRLYDQFLPDYAGGPFETMMIGQQAIARAEAEGPMKLRNDESRGWVQEISYVNDRQSSSSINGYNGSGFGAAAGFEEANDDGAVGVAAAFLTNAIHNSVQVPDASLSASVVEAGVYWRSTGPGLNASANVNAGWAFFQSHRYVIDQAANTTAATLIRGAKSSWSGGLVSAQIELNYPVNIGRYYLRPEVSADYVALYEGAHAERNGGSAVDLSIASKTSQEAAVQGDVVMGATFGDTVKWRPEVTLGWREIIAGGPASTTAHFSTGGANFVLSPQFSEKGGFLARLGLRAGGAFADFSADAGGVFRNGYETYDARAMARFLF